MTNWKRWELEGAKALGGTRTGPMGRDLPDSIDIPIFAPEFKYQKKLSLRKTHINQARENAGKIGKEWVIGLREAHTGERLAVLDWNLFVEIVRKYIDTV